MLNFISSLQVHHLILFLLGKSERQGSLSHGVSGAVMCHVVIVIIKCTMYNATLKVLYYVHLLSKQPCNITTDNN